MNKKIFILSTLFILIFTFWGCQNQASVETKLDSSDQKIDGLSGEPITLEDIQKKGSINFIQQIAFKNGEISITPQRIIRDGKVVYPPLTIKGELRLTDGTEIRIENNQAIIKTKDKGNWTLTDGQILDLETNAVKTST